MASLNDIETKIQSIIDKLSIKTITGVLPLTFTAKGGTAADWEIYGNDDNGTENLFDIDDITALIDVSNNKGVALTTAGYYLVKSYSSESGYLYGRVYENGSAVGSYYYIKAGSTLMTTRITLAAGQTLYLYDPLTSSTDLEAAKAQINGYQVYLEYSSTAMPTAPDHYIPYQQGVGEQRVDGYYVPLTISQQGQPDKTVDIYIGDTPLTAGQSISKTSTGVDIELFEGENTISTTLYNKPEMTIKYK